jgi:hypothetical protein
MYSTCHLINYAVNDSRYTTPNYWVMSNELESMWKEAVVAYTNPRTCRSQFLYMFLGSGTSQNYFLCKTFYYKKYLEMCFLS